jgi:hypothetical protein
MPYSKKLKVFWFLPMRTATRSCRFIAEYLNFFDSDQHKFIETFEQMDYYLISNVRNPYSRLVSLYLYHIDSEQISDKVNFDLWVTKKIKHESNLPMSLKSKEYIKLMYAFQHKTPDYFVRFESLEEDLRNIWFIKEKYDEKIENIFNNQIRYNGYKSEGNPWQSYYTEELAEFVYDYLKEDFLLLNYDKNSWKDGTS